MKYFSSTNSSFIVSYVGKPLSVMGSLNSLQSFVANGEIQEERCLWREAAQVCNCYSWSALTPQSSLELSCHCLSKCPLPRARSRSKRSHFPNMQACLGESSQKASTLEFLWEVNLGAQSRGSKEL